MQDKAGTTKEQDIALPATTPVDDASATDSPFGAPMPVQQPVVAVADVPAAEPESFWATGILMFGLLVLLALATFRIMRDREALQAARRETREARNEARRARAELAARPETPADPEPVESPLVAKLETRMRALLAMSRKMRGERDALERANARLKGLVMSDPLTGLMNAGRFTEQIEAELRRSLRIGKPLTLFICDIDGFRGFNEAHGPERGDLLLQHIASRIESLFRRGGDTVARLGPDRFGVLAPDTDYQAAVGYGETFRSDVEKRDFADASSDMPEFITVSLGITEINPDQPRTTREVLERTALTVQLAKRKGGNRVLGTRLRIGKGAATGPVVTDSRASEPDAVTSATPEVRAQAAENK